MLYVKNPETGRMIQYGGKVHKTLQFGGACSTDAQLLSFGKSMTNDFIQKSLQVMQKAGWAEADVYVFELVARDAQKQYKALMQANNPAACTTIIAKLQLAQEELDLIEGKYH